MVVNSVPMMVRTVMDTSTIASEAPLLRFLPLRIAANSDLIFPPQPRARIPHPAQSALFLLYFASYPTKRGVYARILRT